MKQNKNNSEYVYNFMRTIPFKALLVEIMLNLENYESMYVGGAIRDSILGRPSNDFDICTNATPIEITTAIKKRSKQTEYAGKVSVVPTGIEYGTVTIIVDGEGYEVTTYRKDGNYKDGRRPYDVEFTDNIYVDLMRRDFTMNAIAYNYNDGFIDPFSGIDDIENKIVRTVGNPRERFEEDGLRILRALRFAAQLGFTIEEKTAMAIHECKYMLDSVSKERIQKELCKILMSDACGAYVIEEYMDIFKYIIPELNLRLLENSLMMMRCVDTNINHCDFITRLALFICNVEQVRDNFYSTERTQAILKDLKFSNEIIKNVAQLVSYRLKMVGGDKPFIKKHLNDLGYEQYNRLLALKKLCVCANSSGDDFDRQITKLLKTNALLDEIIDNNECYSLKQLAINGDNLIERGINDGKQIKQILNMILDMVCSGKVKNKKKKLLKAVDKLI